jgi:uncharacterized protein YbgA (DUF1722 family)/uncharacterized protein YbbK (DUF523 family)
LTKARPAVGVSSCLLGNGVRFDGGHKRQAFLVDDLAAFVDFVPVCPEVEMGLPVPRETLRLVERGAGEVRLMGNKTGTDFTEVMERWAEQRVAALAPLDLDGYVLKKDSPSCGVERVRLKPVGAEPPSALPVAGGLAPVASRPPSRAGAGRFASMLRERLPALPLTEEGWLMDAGRRESFLARVFTHHRLREALAHGGRHALVQTHAAHKFLYMAHSPRGQHSLGRVVAHPDELAADALVPTYVAGAMALLAHVATRGKHANVLQHILGFFKDVLAPAEKSEILALIEEFRGGLHTLAVPLTLLTHHLHRHQQEGWLATQVYFDPFPKQLGFRMDGAR